MLKTYQPNILPFNIAISDEDEIFCKHFVDGEGKPLEKLSERRSRTGCEFGAFKDGYYYVCIYLVELTKQSVWTHEAFHAAQDCLDYFGFKYNAFEDNELFAYTIEYVFECIQDFVEQLEIKNLEKMQNQNS